MPEAATKLGDNVWVKGSVAGALLIFALGAYSAWSGLKQHVDEKWSGIDKNVAVMATKFEVFEKGQDEVVSTLKEIRDNLKLNDGERSKMETRLTVIEEWRSSIDRKLDIIDRKIEEKNPEGSK